MSKAPAPERLPAPKSISKRAASNAEHDRLLRLVWDKLDAVVMAVYLEPARRFAADAVTKADDYPREVEWALQEAKSWLKECGGGEVSASLKTVVEQLSFAKRAGLPELLPEVYLPVVESKDLAAPIHDDTSSGQKLVGYIDAQVRMNTVRSIYFKSGIPHWLRARKNETREERNQRRADFRAVDANRYGVEPASWSGMREKQFLWIDVRPQLMPIGQIMRELKVLRSYAPNSYSRYGVNTDIVVAYGDDDAVAQEMLINEGFIPAPERVIRTL